MESGSEGEVRDRERKETREGGREGGERKRASNIFYDKDT
jgi:hypothetical protein